MHTTISKVFHVPQDLIIDVATLLDEYETIGRIKGGSQQDATVAVELQYNKNNPAATRLISHIERVITDYYDFMDGETFDASYYLQDQ